MEPARTGVSREVETGGEPVADRWRALFRPRSDSTRPYSRSHGWPNARCSLRTSMWLPVNRPCSTVTVKSNGRMPSPPVVPVAFPTESTTTSTSTAVTDPTPRKPIRRWLPVRPLRRGPAARVLYVRVRSPRARDAGELHSCGSRGPALKARGELRPIRAQVAFIGQSIPQRIVPAARR